MAAPSLMLASPCYGGQMHAICLRSILALADACAGRGVALEVELGGGEALISRARGAMMADFLNRGASHLLFVDADIGFPPEAAFRLLDAGQEVVGGAYPRKAQPPEGPTAWEADPLPGGELVADGLQEVGAVGCGFLLIARPAAERMAAAYPELRARLGDLAGAAAPAATMVFDNLIEPGTGRYLADHQAFCRRWRELGGRVFARFGLGLTHLGEVEHRG